MASVLHPRLRPVEIIPIGPEEELLLALRDPQGFGEVVVLPYGAVVLSTLMDGKRTLAEIQEAFQRRTGVQVALTNLQQLIGRLDEAYLLCGARFERHRCEQIEGYLRSPVRAASHAGGAYAAEPERLRGELAAFFTAEEGPGPIDAQAAPRRGTLCGLLSPHVDLHRGGPVYAWGYKEVAQCCDADLFLVFGTAHYPMQEFFCVSRKDFDTPLGTVRTDQPFIDRLAEHLASSVAGQQLEVFADELVHRGEHSIEFQAVFLQYVFGGRREFRIVPVLVGSFHEFLAGGGTPGESPEIEAFLAAVRAAAEGHTGAVCCVSAADFAHIGRRFGDPWLLDPPRLEAQTERDRKLLEAVCRHDPEGFYRAVAEQEDRGRICGLSPTYAMLAFMRPARGRLLKYAQAVDEDRTGCVSFAAAAFYRD